MILSDTDTRDPYQIAELRDAVRAARAADNAADSAVFYARRANVGGGVRAAMDAAESARTAHVAAIQRLSRALDARAEAGDAADAADAWRGFAANDRGRMAARRSAHASHAHTYACDARDALAVNRFD